MTVSLAWYQVRLRLLLGDVDTAFRWAKGDKMPLEHLPTVLREVQQVSLARVYLAQEELEKVLAIYDRLCVPAQAAGRMARVIEISLLKALALQARGEFAAALVPFEQCLSLAEPGGYVRLFLEAGAPVVMLLRQAASHGISPGYVSKLLAAFGVSECRSMGETLPHVHTQPLIEPLTKRELEVLRLVVRGLSNQEIAEVLFIAVGTVKTHVHNIYGKLGVRDRPQAIARAGELNLV
jgi:LuxR family maltose regulon positive regulatory protein